MTRASYLKALSRLNLRPYGQETELALGLDRRQLARLSAGTQDVRPTLERLLTVYLAHGIPEKYQIDCRGNGADRASIPARNGGA